jgi:hypothetical protein
MKILSPEFADDNTMPEKYTCRGEAISPPLQILEVPAEAKSLALTMRDPDAPNGDYVHWLLWNISPQATEIAENTLPTGAVAGSNSSGETEYVAPCPPAGIHRYRFELFALNNIINLPEAADIGQLEAAMNGKMIGSSVLVGLVGQN